MKETTKGRISKYGPTPMDLGAPLTIRLFTEQEKMVNAYAAKNGVSVNTAVRALLRRPRK